MEIASTSKVIDIDGARGGVDQKVGVSDPVLIAPCACASILEPLARGTFTRDRGRRASLNEVVPEGSKGINGAPSAPGRPDKGAQLPEANPMPGLPLALVPTAPWHSLPRSPAAGGCRHACEYTAFIWAMDAFTRRSRVAASGTCMSGAWITSDRRTYTQYDTCWARGKKKPLAAQTVMVRATTAINLETSQTVWNQPSGRASCAPSPGCAPDTAFFPTKSTSTGGAGAPGRAP